MFYSHENRGRRLSQQTLLTEEWTERHPPTLAASFQASPRDGSCVLPLRIQESGESTLKAAGTIGNTEAEGSLFEKRRMGNTLQEPSSTA